MDGHYVTVDAMTSPAAALFLQLTANGYQLAVEGEHLRVRPASRVTAELVGAIRQYAADLKMLVRSCQESVEERREVFARQLAASAPGTVPAFVFKPDLPYVAGSCFSCGSALEAHRFGRCWCCSVAWRLVARVLIPSDAAVTYDEARLLA